MGCAVDAQVSAWGLNSIGENPDGLTHALGNIFVVALFFGAFGPNGWTEADLEFESFSSNQGARDRLQHIRWSPVVRQAFNNWQKHAILFPHEPDEMFKHPGGRVGDGDKFGRDATPGENL